MFEGSAPVNIDAKSRITVPTRFRDLLLGASDKIVITRDPCGCLLLMSFDVWEPTRDHIVEMTKNNPNNLGVKSLRRLVVGSARQEKFDPSGKVLLPEDLRKYAGFDKHVLFVGNVTHFELWEPSKFDAQSDMALEGASVVNEKLPEAYKGVVI